MFSRNEMQRAPGLPFVPLLASRESARRVGESSRDAIPLSLLVQRFSHLSLASARRPEERAFNQCRLDHTRFALTTQGRDDFLVRGL